MGKRKTSERKSQENSCVGNIMQNKNASISVLDDDSLRHVFTFLPVIDRIRIQRVCKKWQRISKLPWSDLKEINCDFDVDYERYLLIKLSTIKNILEIHGKYLTSLSLPTNHVASSSVLLKLVKKTCPNLRSINLTGLTITRTTAQFLADNFNDFTDIQLGDNWSGCENSISQFLLKNTKLRSIEFSRCRLNGSCMATLPAESLNKICITTGDNFSPENVRDAFLNFSKLRQLLVLYSDKLMIYMEAYLQALPNPSSLETLIIRCNSLRSKEIVKMRNIGLFDNLRELALVGNSVLYDQILITVGAHCKNLFTATLYDSDRVTDVGMQSIVEIPSLEKLLIFNLDNVTDESFDEKEIPSLKDLRCYDCINITNGTFDHVLGTCKTLQRLDVVGCTIGEECLINVARVSLSKRDTEIGNALELYLIADDEVEEVIKVSSRLRILRKKEEFFFGRQWNKS